LSTCVGVVPPELVVVVVDLVVVVVVGVVDRVVVVVVGVVDRVVVVVVGVVVGDAPQVTPLTENAVGVGLAAVHVPLKPMPVEAPLATEAFQATLVAVTAVPLCDQFADQPWVTFWPASPKLKRNVQPLQASPVLRSVTLTLIPPGQPLP
jgi:hypothetical protein